MKTYVERIRGQAGASLLALVRGKSPASRLLPVSPSLRLAFFSVFLVFASSTRAQWQTPSYALKGGWNSIYLHGDATHATLDQLFAANPEVIEVWRWNPNPTQAQFQASPLIPSAGTPEWTKWIRGAPDAATQLIPPFLLLPLVENALKHGRQSTAGVLKVRLSARLEDDRALVLEVANTGTWLELGESQAPSTGIGLENLRQRLKRSYPGAHRLTNTTSDGCVVITLRLASPSS